MNFLPEQSEKFPKFFGNISEISLGPRKNGRISGTVTENDSSFHLFQYSINMSNSSQISEYENFISDIRSKIRLLEREPCTLLRNVLGRYLQIILEISLARLEQLREEENRAH